MAKYTLSDLFKGDYPISQYYGQRPEYYQQFGLAGHEGVDWATPTGVKIVAPFDSEIIRDVDDPKSGAYGEHLVVWDRLQKCAIWFCHLQDNSVSIGDKVTKGQVLGHTDNSGNSSGPHLHVNLVETDDKGNRLNLNNGYKGFLNILDPVLVEWKLGNNQPIPQPANEPLPVIITDQTKIPQILDMEVQAIRSTLNDLKDVIRSRDNQINDLTSSAKQQYNLIVSLQQQLKDCQNKPVETSITADDRSFLDKLRALFKF